MKASLLSVFCFFLLVATGCNEQKKNELNDSASPTDNDTVSQDAAGDDGSTEATDDLFPDDGLPNGIYELNGVDPELPAEDMTPFGEHVGSATLVGLGEAIHGSGGFLKAKHRLIRYLVENKGFRVVAFETEWTRAEKVDAYLQDCNGDAATVVLEGLRPTWQAKEVADLLAWLCLFNTAHPDDKVRFFGFNNFQPWDDAPPIVTFVNGTMTESAAQVVAGIDRCQGVKSKDEDDYYQNMGTLTIEDHQACIAALDAVDTYLNEHEASLTLSAEELRWLRTRILSLRGWDDYCYGSYGDPAYWGAGMDSRDRSMAAIMTTMKEMRHPEEKIVFSAHNLHVNDHAEQLDLVYPEQFDGYQEGNTRMGSHLALSWGENYRPIGLTAYRFSEGTQMLPFVVDEQEGIPAGVPILEVLLHQLGAAVLFLDLNEASEGNTPFLVKGNKYRICIPDTLPGGLYIVLYEVVPRNLFSGIIFVDESDPMEPFPL